MEIQKIVKGIESGSIQLKEMSAYETDYLGRENAVYYFFDEEAKTKGVIKLKSGVERLGTYRSLDRIESVRQEFQKEWGDILLDFWTINDITTKEKERYIKFVESTIRHNLIDKLASQIDLEEIRVFFADDYFLALDFNGMPMRDKPTTEDYTGEPSFIAQIRFHDLDGITLKNVGFGLDDSNAVKHSSENPTKHIREKTYKNK